MVRITDENKNVVIFDANNDDDSIAVYMLTAYGKVSGIYPRTHACSMSPVCVDGEGELLHISNGGTVMSSMTVEDYNTSLTFPESDAIVAFLTREEAELYSQMDHDKVVEIFNKASEAEESEDVFAPSHDVNSNAMVLRAVKSYLKMGGDQSEKKLEIAKSFCEDEGMNFNKFKNFLTASMWGGKFEYEDYFKYLKQM